MQQGPSFNFQKVFLGGFVEKLKCTAMALAPQRRRPDPPRRPNTKSPPREAEPVKNVPSTRTPLSSLLSHGVLSAYKNTAETLARRDLTLHPQESSPRAVACSIRFA